VALKRESTGLRAQLGELRVSLETGIGDLGAHVSREAEEWQREVAELRAGLRVAAEHIPCEF